MEILHGVWLLMQAHWLFALAVPFGSGLFIILTIDLIGSMRGKPSIFDPPWMMQLRLSMAIHKATIEQIRKRRNK